MQSTETSITGIIGRTTLLVFLCALVIGSATLYLFYSAASTLLRFAER